jgi:hypothetical protein
VLSSVGLLGVNVRDAVRLNFHQPIAIDEPFDFNEGVGRLGIRKNSPCARAAASQ